MKLFACLLLICGIAWATASVADNTPTYLYEWNFANKSMHDYISDGYDLKSTENNGVVSLNTNAPFVQTFFHQKNGTLVRCDEPNKGLREVFGLSPPEQGPPTLTRGPACYELIQPTRPK